MNAEIPDEVDDIVLAWHRERADLNLAPVEVFSRVSRLTKRLDLARREAFVEHHIEPWEFDVLAALRRSGRPYQMTPGALIRETLVTSGTMTNRIDRLEDRGHVLRHPDPSDRRGVLVGLTVRGKRTVDAAFESLLVRERELLDCLDPDESALLGQLLKRVMAGL